MRRWKITYADASENIALGIADIWTGTPKVVSVQDLGVVTAPSPAPTPKPVADASSQRRAMVRASARELDRKKKYLEASALRATIGE